MVAINHSDRSHVAACRGYLCSGQMSWRWEFIISSHQFFLLFPPTVAVRASLISLVLPFKIYTLVPKSLQICGARPRMLSGTRPGSGWGTSCSRGGGGGTRRGRSSPTPGTGTGGSRRMILATQVRGLTSMTSSHRFREIIKINGVQLIGLYPIPYHVISLLFILHATI